MKRRYQCRPLEYNKGYCEVLNFEWDEVTGELTGQSAEWIRRIAQPKAVILMHPQPSGHQLSSDPLKSKTDMAAVIGYNHELPADLMAFYPAPAPASLPKNSHFDEQGVWVVGLDEVVF